MNQELTKPLYDLSNKPLGHYNLFNCWELLYRTISSEDSYKE